MNKYQQESMNSRAQEVEEDVDLGVGRSYECVFCKRGFNTAQALGGHMNIHRKDRAPGGTTTKTHHNNKSTNQETITYPQIILPPPPIPIPIPIPFPADYRYASCYNLQPPAAESRRFESELFISYDAGTTEKAATSFGGIPHDCRPDGYYYQQGFNPFQVQSGAGEWRLGLRNREDSEEEVGVRQKQEEELDLELRLGYDC